MGFDEVIREHSQMEVVTRETAFFGGMARVTVAAFTGRCPVRCRVAATTVLMLGVLEAMDPAEYARPGIDADLTPFGRRSVPSPQGELTRNHRPKAEALGRLAVQSAVRLH